MQKNTPLETMYMEYANTVKHFLISLCGNFDLAEDLTQKTFYQAYKSAHRYNGNYKISVWLCQIAKHLYFDYLKKEKHKTTVGIEHLESFEAINNQRNLEDTYLIKEETKKLLSALRQVKLPYGQVFWLRAYEEMSFKEIGEIFDKSENWARVNYFRAKTKIRKVIEDENNENNM